MFTVDHVINQRYKEQTDNRPDAHTDNNRKR